MIRAHVIKLDPNNKQVTYFAQACGVARFTYNWGLALWKDLYEAGHKPSQYVLRKILNRIKRDQYPWMMQVTKTSPQYALIHLGAAFDRFFKGKGRYPVFKKKGTHESFTISNDQFRLEGKKIRIPKLGWVRLREHSRFQGRIIEAVISRKADGWYVAISVEVDDNHVMTGGGKNHGPVGVDMGIETFATLSTGEKIAHPRHYRRSLDRVKRASKAVSRCKKHSKNRKKALNRLARIHQRIRNQRLDTLHKTSHALSQRFSLVGIEDLNITGMTRNHRLALHVLDQGWGEFRRQLEYKTQDTGCLLVVVDRWFPSTKTCHACSYMVEVLPLQTRAWSCPACGITHDRDVNAAINIRDMAVSSTVNARGGTSSGQQCVVGETSARETGSKQYTKPRG